MSFRFGRGDIGEEVRRIGGEQIERALAELDEKDADGEDVVHQVRKRCKKLRGLLRLVRPSCEDLYKAENAWFRDTARLLSGVRDVEAMIERYDDLMERFADQVERRAFQSIRARLTRERKAADDGALRERLRGVHGRMEEARMRVGGWKLSGEGLEAIEGGLKKTYGRARRAMKKAGEAGTPEAFHEWRKRVKYHWCHTRLLRDVWRPMLKARARELKKLSDALGEHHDLVVFEKWLAESGDGFGGERDLEVFRGLIRQRLAVVEKRAIGRGRRLFVQKSGALASAWESYWLVWRAEE